MTPKNITRLQASKMLCMQCGGEATTRHVDLRQDVPLVTTWCDWHAPDVWQIVARARRRAEDREWNAGRVN